MKSVLVLELWRTLLLLVPLGIVLVIASITDIHSRKIYNKLTYPSFLVGLILHAIAMGLPGLGDGLLGALVMFVLGLIVMPFGWIKPGDFKLFMVVGAFIGLRGVGEVFFYSVFVGGILAALHSLVTGNLFKVSKRVWYLTRNLVYRMVYWTKNFTLELEEDEKTDIPYAPFILIGTICVFTDHVYGIPGWMLYYFSKIGLPS